MTRRCSQNSFDRHLVRRVLESVAFAVFAGEVPERQSREAFLAVIRAIVVEGDEPDIQIKSIPFLLDWLCRECAVLREVSGDSLQFESQVWLQFFAATETARRLDSGRGFSGRHHVYSLVNRRAWDPSWEHFVLFLAGKTLNPIRIIRLIQRRDDFFRHRLALAAQCLVEANPLAPGYRAAVSSVTKDMLTVWWRFRFRQTHPALRHFPRAVAAVGKIHGAVNGARLDEWINDRLKSDAFQGTRCPPLWRAVAAFTAGLNAKHQGKSYFAGALGKYVAALDALTIETACHTAYLLGGPILSDRTQKALLELLSTQGINQDQVREAAAFALSGAMDASVGSGMLDRMVVLLFVDPSESVRRGVAEALGRLPAARFASQVQQSATNLLSAPDEDTRRIAAESVGYLRLTDETWRIPLLLGLIRNDSDQVSRAAEHSLVTVAASTDLPMILAELSGILRESLNANSESPGALLIPPIRLTLRIIRTLGNIGPIAAAVFRNILPALLNRQEPDVFGTTLDSIEKMGTAAATDELLDQLCRMLEAGQVCADGTPPQRIAQFLGRVATPGNTPWLIPRLVRLLSNSDALLRESSVIALGAIGTPAATSQVLAELALLLSDSNSGVRFAVLVALENMGPAAAVAEVSSALGNLSCIRDKSLLEGAIRAMGSIYCGQASAGTRKEIQELISGHSPLSRTAARTLVRILVADANQGVASTLPLLRHSDPYIRATVLDELCACEPQDIPEEIVGALAKSLVEEDRSIQLAAARLLGGKVSVGVNPQTIATLMNLLNGFERQEAARAIADLLSAGLRVFRRPPFGWTSKSVIHLSGVATKERLNSWLQPPRGEIQITKLDTISQPPNLQDRQKR